MIKNWRAWYQNHVTRGGEVRDRVSVRVGLALGYHRYLQGDKGMALLMQCIKVETS